MSDLPEVSVSAGLPWGKLLGNAFASSIPSYASSLIGFGLNQISQNIAYKRNQELANMQNQYNIDQWNRENAYNHPLAQMQRLRAAGLNPNLVQDSLQGAASSPSLVAGSPMGASPSSPPVVESALAADLTRAQTKGADEGARLSQVQQEVGRAAAMGQRLANLSASMDNYLRNLPDVNSWDDYQSFSEYMNGVIQGDSNSNAAKEYANFGNMLEKTTQYLSEQVDSLNLSNQEHRAYVQQVMDDVMQVAIVRNRLDKRFLDFWDNAQSAILDKLKFENTSLENEFLQSLTEMLAMVLLGLSSPSFRSSSDFGSAGASMLSGLGSAARGSADFVFNLLSRGKFSRSKPKK